MSVRKFKGSALFNGYELLPAECVLITDEAGQVIEIVKTDDAGDNIEQLEGILSPGFINCHCHLELSHMKGLIPERTGLVDFVFSVVSQRHFPPAVIEAGIARAEKEMLDNGIVAVGDICNNLDTLAQKLSKNLHYYNFIEASGWLPAIADQRFKASQAYYNAFSSSFYETSMVPHAPYSVSGELWQLLKPGFKDKTVSIHNQETSFEDELFIQNTGDFARMYRLMKLDTSFYQPSGKSSLQTYFHHLSTAKNVILVHNTFIKREDVQYIKETGKQHDTFFCLCPNANLYIEQSLPPVNLLQQEDCSMVIGTDSLASNYQLNVLEELKTIQRHFREVKLKDLLKWSTSNGARALTMQNELGSFETGKKPGILLITGVEENQQLVNARCSRLL